MKQKRFIGFGSIAHLHNLVCRYDAKRLLLITGKRSFHFSGASQVIPSQVAGCKVATFTSFTNNPKMQEVARGIRVLRQHAPDVVVAVGGGSVIDMAKLINILAAQADAPADYVLRARPLTRRGMPLVAIPTTAGSGSEATHFAVVYAGKRKYSLEHDFMLPDVAIVDPQFTMNLPPGITAATGLDALAQAMESFWSVNSDAASKAYSRQAIRLILANLPAAVHRPSARARLQMARAACLAGRAIDITRTTASHAISYTLTARHSVDHGQAVALTLGALLYFNSQVADEDVADPRGADYVRATMAELCQLLGCPNARRARDFLRRLIADVGLKTSMRALGIDAAEAKREILRHVNAERLRNNPRRVSKEALTHLLNEVR